MFCLHVRKKGVQRRQVDKFGSLFFARLSTIVNIASKLVFSKSVMYGVRINEKAVTGLKWRINALTVNTTR